MQKYISKLFVAAGIALASVGAAHAAQEQFDGTFNAVSLAAAAELLGNKACLQTATEAGFVKDGAAAKDLLAEIPVKGVTEGVRQACGDALDVAMNFAADQWLIQAEDGCLFKDGSLNPDALMFCTSEQVADERVIGKSMERSSEQYRRKAAQFEATKLSAETLARIRATLDGSLSGFQAKVLQRHIAR